MDFDYRTVPLSRIRDDDITYRITTGYAATGLIASIQNIGLINPPIVRPQGERFAVVSGFGRIAACRALNWEAIAVRCVPSHCPFSHCALTAIADNAAQRELNIVEMARAFGLLARAAGEADEQSPLQRLQSIGLTVNAELGKKLNAINQMSEPLQQGLVDGTLALPTALRLHAMSDEDAVGIICRMFRELNLSLNRQREILDWVNGIAMRDVISTTAVLEGDPIAGWLSDPQLDRGRKTQLIREHLKKRRYPEIVRFEDQYQRGLKELKLAKGIRLEPPAHFEGQTFGLHLAFNDQEALGRLFSQIEQLLHSPAFSALLTPIK